MTYEEKEIAKRTSRSSGASAVNKDGTIRAIVPRFVEQYVTDKATSILDFGAGRGATSTKYLRNNGFSNVTAYDFWVDDGDALLDGSALDRQYRVVFASNVLNVQSSKDMLMETLAQIYDVIEEGGEFICNYPSSPRKMEVSADTISEIIQEVFKNSISIIGGTKSAPMLKIKKYSNKC